MIEPFAKLVKNFLVPNYFCKKKKKKSIYIYIYIYTYIYQGREITSGYIYSNVVKKTFHVKTVFVSNLIIIINGHV